MLATHPVDDRFDEVGQDGSDGFRILWYALLVSSKASSSTVNPISSRMIQANGTCPTVGAPAIASFITFPSWGPFSEESSWDAPW